MNLRNCKKSHTVHCTHTAGSANVKVQNIFHSRNNITRRINCKYITAAKRYILKTWFVSSIYRKSWATFFLHANWEQQTKESTVINGTSCCVILECLVTSIACITWPVSLLTKWPTTICRFTSVLSSNFLLKRKSLLQKFTRDFRVLMEVCAWVRAVFEDGWNILNMGTRASKMSLGAVALEQPPLNATRREWMRSFKITSVWLWTQQPKHLE